MYFEGRLGDRFKIWCENSSEYREAIQILKAEEYDIYFEPTDIPNSIGLFLGICYIPHKVIFCDDSHLFQSCDTYRQVSIHQLRAASSSSYQNPEIDIGSLTALVDSLMK